MSDLGSFEEAFRDGAGFTDDEGRSCACGKEFTDSSYISFEGVEYFTECDCWHKRAEQIMKFLDAHAHKIARYMNLEKKRKTDEANRMPEIKE